MRSEREEDNRDSRYRGIFTKNILEKRERSLTRRSQKGENEERSTVSAHESKI